MKKLLIVCFYELKDYFIGIKESFEHFGYIIDSYPLFRYAYDSHDKLKNYTEHMDQYIKESAPDVLLWWFLDVPLDTFKYIKKNNPNIYFIMYNCDEAFNMSSELLKKAQYFDLVMSTSKENLLKYRSHSNVSKIIHNLFGVDHEYFKPIPEDDCDETDEKYCCDISFVCDNLCMDKNYYNCQFINRMEMIDNLIKYADEKNKIFKLFGPPVLMEYYNKYYYGEISYLDQNKLFNKSKININTHAFQNKSQNLNYNTMFMLASGGLMLVDKIKDIERVLVNNKHCIYLNKENYVNQIDEILTNYQKYEHIKKNAVELSKKYSWREWAKKIHIEICRKYFDESSYREVYDISIDTNEINLFDYWLENGLHNNHVCFNVIVPEQFKFEDYAQKFNLSPKNKKYLYVHWFNNSRDEIFMKKKRDEKMQIDTNELFVTMENFFEFCTICNKMKNCDILDDGLNNLDNFSKSHPYCDMNILLDKYLAMIE